MDRIEFRREVRVGWWNDEENVEFEAVEPVINGEGLAELWSRLAPDSPAAALTIGEVFGQGCLWEPTSAAGETAPGFLRIPDGRVAVAACACGSFECRGRIARISVEADEIVWSEFDYRPDPLNTLPSPPDIGPFRFERESYMRSLKSAAPTGFNGWKQ